MHVATDEPVPMMASLLPGWCGGPRDEEHVTCVTIDDLVTETGTERVDVVKIDAEGSEDAVVRGARTTLQQHRPFIFCEVLDRRDLGPALTDELAHHDYCFFRLGPAGPVPCATITGGTDHDENHNYLFAHRSRLGELQPLLVGQS